MNKKIKIISVVGPLGAGKTSFILEALKSMEALGIKKEQVSYVVNDEGAMIDGELARERARVVAMTNGCFTCSDESDLVNVLEQIDTHSMTEWVFLEGFGITSGTETKNFLNKSQFSYFIFSVISAMHFSQDLVRYADVVTSHIKAGNYIIITKSDLDDVLINEEIVDYIGRENPGVPVNFDSNDFNISRAYVSELIFNEHTFITSPEHVCKGSCSHKHHKEHSHSYSCEHDNKSVHHMYPYSFSLCNGVTLQDLKLIFLNKDFVLRVKGSVEGCLFNEIHGQWNFSHKDERNFITFYSSKKLSLEKDFPEILNLIVFQENLPEELSYQMIRRETISREETIMEIKKLLAEIPVEPLVIQTSGGKRIITHPEKLQIVKEIARRPYVVQEFFPEALKSCVVYWIKCFRFLNDNLNEFLKEDISKNYLELSVSLVWWVNRHGQYFGNTIEREVCQLKPTEMIIQSCLLMRSLNSDPERAYWQSMEIIEVLDYGLVNESSLSDIQKVKEHLCSLAYNEALKKVWEETLVSIKN
jgi:G3E family GTPase